MKEPISYRNVEGRRGRPPLGEMLVDVVNHSTYHRGQVVTMLRQLGRPANATDYLLYLDQEG